MMQPDLPNSFLKLLCEGEITRHSLSSVAVIFPFNNLTLILID